MDSLHSSRVETRWGYSAEQLEAIKLFGRKDLSKWLLGIRTTGEPCEYNGEYWESFWHGLQDKNPEILWHIPHLEDLFRVAEEQWRKLDIEYRNDRWFECYTLWIEKAEKKNNWNVILYNPSIPLLDQPNLSDIISLFR